MLADRDLYRFIDAAPPADEAALRERLGRLESRRSPDGTQHWLNWVVRTTEGQVAGYVQATVSAAGEAEIGYVIGRDFWRHGIGSAAVAIMLDELASAQGVTLAIATLDRRNAASLALLRKLGFRYAGEAAADGDLRYIRPLAGAAP